MGEILKIQDFNRGATLKQGDTTTLRYYLYDADEERIEDIIGQSVEVVFIKKGQIHYRTTGAVDDMFVCTFSIDEVLRAGTYHIEFIVSGHIFPSGDKPYFTITRSSKGIDDAIIYAYGFEDFLIRAVDKLNERFVDVTKERLGLDQVLNIEQASRADLDALDARIDDLSKDSIGLGNVLNVTQASKVEFDAFAQATNDQFTTIGTGEQENSAKVYYVDTVVQMKTLNSLKVGDNVVTVGYYAPNDGGGANYRIIATKVQTTHYSESLNNGLFADLMDIQTNGHIDIRWLGAISDFDPITKTGTNVAPYMQRALDITNQHLGMPIKLLGNYYWGTTITTPTDFNIYGEHRPNRTMTGIANNPTATLKSPSELYINPALSCAIHLKGMGGATLQSPKTTHLTVEKLLVHSMGRTADFVRCTAFGGPSRPGYCQDLHATGLRNVFLFDFEEGSSDLGTNYYNFSVRGGCDSYTVNSFISSIGRNTVSASLGGLNVFDNTLEWMNQGAIKAYNLFGYNQVKNNLMEGSPEVLDVSINKGHIDVVGNYFEANQGSFRVRGALGSTPSQVSAKIYGNFFLINTTEYYFSGINLLEMDLGIPLNKTHYNNVILNDTWPLYGVTLKNNVQSYGIATPRIKNIREADRLENQLVFKAGTTSIAEGIQGKALGSTFSLLGSAYKQRTINKDDYIIFNFYKTYGLIAMGTYATGGSPILDFGISSVYEVEGYYTVVLQANATIPEIGLSAYKVNAADTIYFSDVLMTIVPSANGADTLGKYVGIPVV